eukprot:Pgem_evm1s8571
MFEFKDNITAEQAFRLVFEEEKENYNGSVINNKDLKPDNSLNSFIDLFAKVRQKCIEFFQLCAKYNNNQTNFFKSSWPLSNALSSDGRKTLKSIFNQMSLVMHPDKVRDIKNKNEVLSDYQLLKSLYDCIVFGCQNLREAKIISSFFQKQLQTKQEKHLQTIANFEKNDEKVKQCCECVKRISMVKKRSHNAVVTEIEPLFLALMQYINSNSFSDFNYQD